MKTSKRHLCYVNAEFSTSSSERESILLCPIKIGLWFSNSIFQNCGSRFWAFTARYSSTYNRIATRNTLDWNFTYLDFWCFDTVYECYGIRRPKSYRPFSRLFWRFVFVSILKIGDSWRVILPVREESVNLWQFKFDICKILVDIFAVRIYTSFLRYNIVHVFTSAMSILFETSLPHRRTRTTT